MHGSASGVGGGSFNLRVVCFSVLKVVEYGVGV